MLKELAAKISALGNGMAWCQSGKLTKRSLATLKMGQQSIVIPDSLDMGKFFSALMSFHLFAYASSMRIPKFYFCEISRTPWWILTKLKSSQDSK